MRNSALYCSLWHHNAHKARLNFSAYAQEYALNLSRSTAQTRTGKENEEAREDVGVLHHATGFERHIARRNVPLGKPRRVCQ